MRQIQLLVSNGFYWTNWFLLGSIGLIGFILVLSVLLVLLVILVLLVSIGLIGLYWSYWFLLVLYIGPIGFYWSYWFLLVLLVSIGPIGFYFYWFLLVSDGLNGLYWIQFYGSNRNQQTPSETIRDQQKFSNGLYWSLWDFRPGMYLVDSSLDQFMLDKNASS